MQKASISPWNLHKQVICVSYVILENVQEKFQEDWRKQEVVFLPLTCIVLFHHLLLLRNPQGKVVTTNCLSVFIRRNKRNSKWSFTFITSFSCDIGQDTSLCCPNSLSVTFTCLLSRHLISQIIFESFTVGWSGWVYSRAIFSHQINAEEIYVSEEKMEEEWMGFQHFYASSYILFDYPMGVFSPLWTRDESTTES